MRCASNSSCVSSGMLPASVPLPVTSIFASAQCVSKDRFYPGLSADMLPHPGTGTDLGRYLRRIGLHTWAILVMC